ncbi:unnamed protein product [Vitrella brassicaformis CCMP3155]|uniref:BTB domain-containing protein n=2 Tax=Vitrella brassicaformis TaxID=1169539 RepID=A0A0G4FIC0_VITBC|nr:unnamed protein product [Vitrella brassicaformis CCMP3155]|mmetsp:Transcript_49131/g.123149  ORF Transcript_49131/g.123149 Transcript_49131/m.123149 type:complete len:521 (+) Transcript_49131:82-1644(+)|eukprot:CEM13230.1 unnamed protein product [Vitrella brassicaformis CCMP3155]
METELDTADEPGCFQWAPVKAIGNPPRQRSLHVAVVVDKCMYVFGGYDGSNRVNDFLKYNFKTTKWSQIQSGAERGPSARDRHVAVAHDKCIYIFGGYDGSNRINDFWCFDTENETWTPIESQGTTPSPRHSHSAVEYNHSMYVFAGYDGNYRSDFHEFNFAQRKWAPVQVKNQNQAPKARYRTSAVVWKDTMLVFGGHDGAKHLNDFYEYNFEERIWTQIEQGGKMGPPSPRDSHIAVIHGDSMHLFGGSTGQARNDLFEFRLDTREWHEVKPALPNTSLSPVQGRTAASTQEAIQKATPCPRFCHTGVVYNNSLYIFGGYDGQNRLNDFRQFKLVDEVNVEIPSSSLIQDLKNYINSPLFSDVTFIVEGDKRVYAHKLMCVRCSYFRAMFQGEMREARQSEPVEIKNVSHRVFLGLLEYLYTDELDISLDMAMDLFVAADQFGVERLKKLCERKILTSIDIDNAATILQAADLHTAVSLRQSCFDFILRNFDAVSKTQSFEEMGRANVELVFEILKRR